MTPVARSVLADGSKGGKTLTLDNPRGTRLRAVGTTPATNHIEIRQQASKTAGLVFLAKPDMHSRVLPRFFDRVGHETMYASSGNKQFIK